MASIRQRGSFSEARVRRNGLSHLSRSFKTKADARAWATVVESEVERGIYIDRSEAERSTLGDLLRRYIADVSSHKKGRVSDGYRLLSPQRAPIATIKVAGLSGKLMAEWRDKRLKEVSGSTVNRDLNLISHVINVARIRAVVDHLERFASHGVFSAEQARLQPEILCRKDSRAIRWSP